MSDSASIDRRQFLCLMQVGAMSLSCAALPQLAVAALDGGEGGAPLPPGAQSLDAFRQACTACQLCVSQCPSEVLHPALMENGARGFMQPVLKFDLHHFCDYECRRCIEVCPTQALGTFSLEDKKLTRIGRVRLTLDECIVIKKGRACGACAEHCPTGALRMVPYHDGITQPEVVNADACIGCGGCESICPERRKAIIVERLDVHELAAKPKIEKREDKVLDDFGF